MLVPYSCLSLIHAYSWYDLKAFSKPRHWMTRIGYPVVRRLQRHFVAESQRQMREMVEEALG